MTIDYAVALGHALVTPPTLSLTNVALWQSD